MSEFKLYNFDIGPNLIFNEIKLPGHNIVLSPDYEEKRGKILKGEDAITATLYADSNNSALLTREDNTETEIRDICYLFSYLTGRTTFLHTDTKKFTTDRNTLSVVDWKNLSEAAKCAWANRNNFKNNEEKRPFWFYLDIIDISIIQYFALFGCIALEIIQRIETKDMKFKPEPEMEVLIDDVRKLIDKSSISDHNNKKDRLKSTIGRWKSPSAPEGLNLLLQKYDVIQGEVTDEYSVKRIRSINTIRNDLVHGKDMTLPDWPPKDRRLGEAVFITQTFIPNLIKEYVNRKFQLLDFHQPQRNAKRLQYYIDTGSNSDLRFSC